MGEFVDLQVSGPIATIRLNRPPVNALNAQAAGEIGEAVAAVAAGGDVRAVVVYGGEEVFAAGADVREMRDLDPVAMHRYIARFHDAFTRLENLPQVTVAAVTGYALGGGCELALACDFRVCGESARLGQPEILLGVIPGAGGTQRLPRLVGLGRAKELIYSGRHVRAEEAGRMGLVTEVVPDDEVYERALALARRYARGPALALAAAKQAIQTGAQVDLGAGLLVERQAFAALFATEDQKAGFDAFLRRGPGRAEFAGR